ncbi:MAG: amidohydrolase family protein [Acidobacteriota bacterium]
MRGQTMRPMLLAALLGWTCALGWPSDSVAEPIAIVGGTVHTLGEAGTLEGATVVIDEGRIQAVGVDVEVPEGARTLDASGRVVTPGLFESASQIGLVEIGAEASTRDHSTEDKELTASFDISEAINPRTTLIPINRIEGLTRVLVAPRGSTSPVAGRGAVIHLGGTTGYLLESPAALFVDFGEGGAARAGGSRAATLQQFDRQLSEAGRQRDRQSKAKRGDDEDTKPDPALEALIPVLEGKLPVAARVERASDIEAVLRLGQRHGLRLVIVGGAEAWIVASTLAEARVPVVLNPLDNLPASFEYLGATLENAARLHAAGVEIAFTSGDSHNVRNLKQAAGNAVAYGLPWEEGLKAMTVGPAKIWGLQSTYGTLEPGKDADVVIWDGDPLEVTTFADHVFIRGKEIPMVSRQTRLRDRYLRLDRSWPHAYIEP